MKNQLDTYRDLTFPGLSRRRVDVWLPEGFESPRPVLYMHDGQNLFRSTRLIGSGWRVAETISTLAEQGLIDPPIVVGITSTLNRMGDYMPQKPMQSDEALALINSQKTFQKMTSEQFKADDYLRYLVEVVKPFMDEHYQTKSEASNTALMGSSLGGLISLYGLCEYPDVFGMAGCLSTHWPITGEFMLDYLEENLPEPGEHKLYFDRGDQGLDEAYAPWQAKVDGLLRTKGYMEGRDFQTWAFPGDSHHENDWAKRLHIPLTYFFGVQR